MLVAVEPGVGSAATVRHAAELARRRGGRLTLLFIVHQPSWLVHCWPSLLLLPLPVLVDLSLDEATEACARAVAAVPAEVPVATVARRGNWRRLVAADLERGEFTQLVLPPGWARGRRAGRAIGAWRQRGVEICTAPDAQGEGGESTSAW
ncbi:MAG TPA: hypothetical protein VGI73_06415 [Solirubrobacterales bacterium]